VKGSKALGDSLGDSGERVGKWMEARHWEIRLGDSGEREERVECGKKGGQCPGTSVRAVGGSPMSGHSKSPGVEGKGGQCPAVEEKGGQCPGTSVRALQSPAVEGRTIAEKKRRRRSVFFYFHFLLYLYYCLPK
jgi:hypothetical protein